MSCHSTLREPAGEPRGFHEVIRRAYWAIVALWLSVLATVCVAYLRGTRIFGTARLLLAVVAIDTARNLVENFYFGLYFGSQYGLFPGSIAGILGIPELLIIPKIINVLAACLVLGVLLLRWLPLAAKERDDAELGLLDAERRFRLLVDGVREYAIYLLDAKGMVTSWNSGAQRIKGYTADEIIGAHFGRFYREEERLAGAPQQALQIAERDGRFEAKAWRVRKDGSKFWANVVIDAIRDEGGKLLGFAKVTKDITEDKLQEEKLSYLAHFDQLTGLPNRISLLKDVATVLDAQNSAEARVSAVLVGLDDFKAINDKHGHSIGDRLLVDVAARLTAIDPIASRVYRLGGDEFVLLMPNCGDLTAVTKIAASVLKQFEPPFEIDEQGIYVGASAGLAVGSEADATADVLIANADLARMAAKKAGQKYGLFVPEMRAEVHARQAMNEELRRAYANQEFVLYFQPQVRLSDSAVIGTEALLRWQHPQRGLLSPGAFIDALVSSPVAGEVGRWILQTACNAAASWQAEGQELLRVGVNLFPVQFEDKELVHHVRVALQQSGLPPAALELEITENIALDRHEDAIAQLRALREMGVGIAFDDFGTGFASLSSLTRFPLTRIKIDRSFIEKIAKTSSRMDTAVVRSIITMADNLGLDVVAEGVETPQQASFLREKKCAEAQGYLYGKPLPLDQFQGFLQVNRGQLSHVELAG